MLAPPLEEMGAGRKRDGLSTGLCRRPPSHVFCQASEAFVPALQAGICQVCATEQHCLLLAK